MKIDINICFEIERFNPIIKKFKVLRQRIMTTKINDFLEKITLYAIIQQPKVKAIK